MGFDTELPPASSDAVEHADWIELDAILAADGSSSYEDFASQMRISSTTDIMVKDEEGAGIENDEGGELSYKVADKAWAEIERRHRACGDDDGFYPYKLTCGSITLKDEWPDSAYVFQLLLSVFGKDAGPPRTHGERIFEHLSSHAGQAYFGGPANNAKRFRFGFPRPDKTGFKKALQNLCRELRAGSVKEDAALINVQQDSHLDVVVWRPFIDFQESQLIGFGQCATGKHWDGKMSELQPANFTKEWLADSFHPDPVRMFFVPKCIEPKRWNHVTIHAGLVFDRCRITQIAGDLVDELQSECTEWTKHVVNKRQGGAIMRQGGQS